MAIPRYSPPLERIKEEYSRKIRMRMRAEKRKARLKPCKPIPDNSTPWVENPGTLSDLWEISCGVQSLVDRFQKWHTDSKTS